MNGRILSAPILAAFERFKAAYPARPGNPWAPARELFAKLVKGGEDAEGLTRSAAVFAADCARRRIDPEFIPHARTWLKQRRFEDFPAPARDSAPGPERPAADDRLDFLRAVTGPDYFASWIAPLRVEDRAGAVVLIARTGIARDRVQRDFGDRIAEALGPFTWTVERTA